MLVVCYRLEINKPKLGHNTDTSKNAATVQYVGVGALTF